MTRYAIATLLMAGCAWGQQPVVKCSSGAESWVEAGARCHANPKDRVLVSTLHPTQGQTQHGREAVKRSVRSCEKRDWPVGDPVCHGYALSMARSYYLEHPDLFEAEPKAPMVGWGPITYYPPQLSAVFCSKTPDDLCIPTDKTVFPAVASIQIVQIGNLKCDDHQHIEGDGKSLSGNHCVNDDPLKCGKYQHLDYGPTCEPNETCIVHDPTHTNWTRSCADDRHVVTEREWQELMARLKALDRLTQNEGREK